MSLNARAASAAIWIVLVLLPPTWLLIGAAADFLWPEIQPFVSVERATGGWLPVVVLVVLGFGVTAAVMEFGVRRVSAVGDQLKAGGESTLRGVALAVTVIWMIPAMLVGAMTLPMAIAGALVLLAALPASSDAEPPPVEDEDEKPFPLPEPIDPLPVVRDEETERIREDDDTGDPIHRYFHWLFNDEPWRRKGDVTAKEHKLGLAIARGVYDDLRSSDHSVTTGQDYVDRFIAPYLTDDRVSRVAGELRAIAVEENLDWLGEIHLVMAYTLCMPYAYDDERYGGNYPKYPVEMLVDKDGDCEDFSILAGTLLRRLGHKVAFLLMDIEGEDYGHAALAVASPIHVPGVSFYSNELDADLYYCEVTSTLTLTTRDSTRVQWWLGMDPMEGSVDFRLYPI